MEVDGTLVPTAATAPYPKFYLSLTCGKITAVSLPFDFFAPPRSSDLPRTVAEVGAIFLTQGVALTKTVKDKDGKDVEVPRMKVLMKKRQPVLDKDGKPVMVPIRQQLVRQKDSKPGKLPVFKKGDLIYKKNGKPKLEGNDPGFVYRGHHGRIVRGNGLSGSLKLDAYPRWDALIAKGGATEDERVIASVMAENEGAFDSINAWDSQILSLGAMQKTFAPGGGGELATQLAEFKSAQPALFDRFLGQYGWDIVGGNAVYTDPATNQPCSGEDLFEKVRAGITLDELKHPVRKTNTLLAPFVLLGQNELYQDKQVVDFIARLHLALDRKPTTTAKSLSPPASDLYDFKIGDCFHSTLGKTVVLDQSVNTPYCVAVHVGVALRLLYAKIPLTGSKQDPRQWTAAERKIYEKALIEIYGPLRDTQQGAAIPMTHPPSRYEAILKKFRSCGYQVWP